MTSQVCLFADTYKQEVTKIDGGAKVRFRVENLTDSFAGENSFSVTNDASYTSHDYNLSGVIKDLNTREALLKFGIGSFLVFYDYQNGNLKLERGNGKDSLIIEKFFSSQVIVGQRKQVKADTLILRKVVSFRNLGGIDASNVLLLDCSLVDNRGVLRTSNLFVVGTNVQNFHSILPGKVLKIVDGKIKNFRDQQISETNKTPDAWKCNMQD